MLHFNIEKLRWGDNHWKGGIASCTVQNNPVKFLQLTTQFDASTEYLFTKGCIVSNNPGIWTE